MHTQSQSNNPASDKSKRSSTTVLRNGWLPYDVDYLSNPSQAECRTLAQAKTPSILNTSFGSLNKISRNKARQAQHTYIITDGDAALWSHKTISRGEAKALIQAQAAYIAEKAQLLEVQAWLGVGPRAEAVQWLYTTEGANIAGMQQVLGFPRERNEADVDGPFNARFRVVYTPDFHPDVAGGQRILVDLDNWVTYIMGPDYFGESKKAALRMLCHYVFQKGGLVLHAGAKEVLLENDRLTATILGLSGTGKTTTTFSKQGEGVRPVQDDMVVLWPRGELSVTENGCFAKTFGLNAKAEPILHAATISEQAWLENAYQDANGQVDFYKVAMSPTEIADLRSILIETGANQANVDAYIAGDVSYEDALDGDGPRDGWDFIQWTGNGRSIVPLSLVPDAANLDDLPEVRSMGVLNRDEGVGAITPGIVQFTSPAQAAGYFMLGETTKTSAAGKDRGKTRSPFTQPFFPAHHGNQATRFAELLATTEQIGCWMMNTGYVGGDHGGEHALKVKIRHSSAMLEALFRGTIVWTIDEDFGYQVVDAKAPENAALIELVGLDILRPDLYYRRTSRLAVYRAEVAQRNADRVRFLRKFHVADEIVNAVVI
ncbi:MAG: phosphoenolpyruvate carboxykinase (ATP) [Rhodobacterales bacterium]|nr:phosphoenolpyruvate carboxykinase (ATP) [Rhodobacterales bacterium]